MDKPVSIPIIDNPHAPEVFASGLAGVGADGTNLHLTFVSRRANHSEGGAASAFIVNARLVMDIQSVKGMCMFLLKYIDEMQAAPQQAPENKSLH